MAKIKLPIVESPDPALPVISLEDERPFATGNGQDDYVCGRCENALFLNVDMPVPQAMTIICGRCGAANLLSGVGDEKPQTSGIKRIALAGRLQLLPMLVGLWDYVSSFEQPVFQHRASLALSSAGSLAPAAERPEALLKCPVLPPLRRWSASCQVFSRRLAQI